MLKTVIFLIVFFVVIGILALLPQIEINKDAVITSSAWQWVRAAMYFLPFDTCIQIGTVVLGLAIWSMIISVVKTFWDIFPFH